MATISINNIAQAIYDSSKDKSGASLEKIMQNTAKFLADTHMLGKASQIIDKVEQIADKDGGIVRAKISSKQKLSSKTIEELEDIVKKRYRAKNIILTFQENLKLLGGIKIEVGDEVLNMTLKNKLDKLQNYLNAN